MREYMCTAISLTGLHHYFGRNLDLEYGYQEQIAVTPRNYPFQFRHLPTMSKHFAMIGMATVIDGYPLYYEATNEVGLSVAALNFPDLAHYGKETNGNENVAVFEFIPWVLSQFRSVSELMPALPALNIVDTPFSPAFPPTPLHFMISDKAESIVLEPIADGLKCHHNPIGVMTNAPEFPYHLNHLKDYQTLSPLPPDNTFAPTQNLTPYSGAMGAIGLPGDWSSASRFVRAAFVKLNSPSLETEEKSVSQFFRILQTVAMPMGSVRIKPGLHDITRYSCCCNTDTGRYYYTTYHNSCIHCIDMHYVDLTGCSVTTYDLIDQPKIIIQNQP